MKNVRLHSIVLMIGPSGSGKSTLASKLFKSHEIISSDNIRAELTGDFRIQSRNDEVFDEVHRRTELLIRRGQRAVVDATHLKAKDRKFYVDLAKKYEVNLYYLVVNRPLEEKIATGGWRLEVERLIEKHDETFNNSIKEIMKGDGFATVVDVNNDDFNIVVRRDFSSDMLVDAGYSKLMVVGDVHGNFHELVDAAKVADQHNAFTVYLGDVIDYGDNNVESFRFVYDRVMNGKALMVWGNHERKLDMWVRAGFGSNFKGKIGHGMQKTVDEISKQNRNVFYAAWNAMESMSKQHYVFGNVLLTHAAATVELWTIKDHRPHGEHGQLAYFGQVDKTTPFRDDGYPNRIYDWTMDVPSGRTVIVGHDIRSTDSPLVEINSHGGKTVFLDTGSGKNGKLSHVIVDIAGETLQ